MIVNGSSKLLRDETVWSNLENSVSSCLAFRVTYGCTKKVFLVHGLMYVHIDHGSIQEKVSCILPLAKKVFLVI